MTEKNSTKFTPEPWEACGLGPTYKDRSFCESADACGVKDCPRRLSEADKEAVKKGGWVVATIPMCGKFVFKKAWE